MKYGAGTNSGGDFAGLALDGPGGDVYHDSIVSGATKLFRIGDHVDPQTGDLQGPTRDGIKDRMARPAPSGCPGNEKDDIFRANPDGSYSIRPQCVSSGRIMIIPIVDQISNPELSTILGFAFMYLKGYSMSGGHMQVIGHFMEFVTELPNSYYAAPAGDATAIKLLE